MKYRAWLFVFVNLSSTATATCYQVTESAARGTLVATVSIQEVTSSPRIRHRCARSLSGALTRSLKAGELVYHEDVDQLSRAWLRWRGYGNRVQIEVPVNRVIVDGDGVVMMNKRSGKSLLVQ